MNIGSTISAAFLIAGTCMGGGMLAMPLAAWNIGLYPSLFVMVTAWLAMTATALLFIQATLAMPVREGHMISLVEYWLGSKGAWIARALYLFIGYASLVAYTAAGGSQLQNLLPSTLQENSLIGAGLFLLFFGPLISSGAHRLTRLNDILFILMIMAWIALIFSGIGAIQVEHFEYSQWSGLTEAMPLLLTAFSFQTMVPSLPPLLNYDRKSLNTAVVLGTTIALVIYVIWQIFVLGLMPPEILRQAWENGSVATEFLGQNENLQWIHWTASTFGFLGLITSFLGIGLGLFDFLVDHFEIKTPTIRQRISIGLGISLPCFYFATVHKRAFVIALDTTGGIGDSILNGFIPILMTVVLYRKAKNMPLPIKIGLSILTLIFGTTLWYEWQQFWAWVIS
ncbi:MAG: amino acid permease [Oligoflexales bacterium]